MKKILFSPVGFTDPVKYFHDGGLLHICRHYLPDKVYIYITKETGEYEDGDHRYTYCLKKLGELLNHPFEYEIIRDDDMIEVQVFDTFVELFRKTLPKIIKKEGIDHLMVNISSGTPAMKSALLFLSALSDRYQAIQVASPHKKRNNEPDEKESSKVEEYWLTNEDNEPEAKNRCSEAAVKNWSSIVKREIVKQHIETYDYVAALDIAREIDDMPSDFITFLKAADARLKMDYGLANNLLIAIGQTEVVPIKSKKTRPLVEYTLSLKVKLFKQEYADFVRALSPIVFDLYEIILNKELGVDVKAELAVKYKNGSYHWNKNKIYKHPKIRQIFIDTYRHGQPPYGEFVNNASLYALISNLLTSKSKEKIRETVEKLHRVERSVRNQAAHEVDAVVTAKSIKNQVHQTPEEIMQMIQTLMDEYVTNHWQNIWNSYDLMNEKLLAMMHE